MQIAKNNKPQKQQAERSWFEIRQIYELGKFTLAENQEPISKEVREMLNGLNSKLKEIFEAAVFARVSDQNCISIKSPLIPITWLDCSENVFSNRHLLFPNGRYSVSADGKKLSLQTITAFENNEWFLIVTAMPTGIDDQVGPPRRGATWRRRLTTINKFLASPDTKISKEGSHIRIRKGDRKVSLNINVTDIQPDATCEFNDVYTFYYIVEVKPGGYDVSFYVKQGEDNYHLVVKKSLSIPT